MSAWPVNMTLPARNVADHSGCQPANGTGSDVERIRNVELIRDVKVKRDAELDRDIELMRDVAAGELGALDRLLAEHQTDVRRMVGRLTAWGSDVDDLTQEVFLKAWRAAKTFDGRGSLRSWLLAIAVRQCRNHHRATTRWLNALARLVQRKRDEGATALVDLQPGNGDDRNNVHQAETIDERWLSMQKALSKLSNRDRELLVLVVMEQQPASQVAESLGITTDTLYVRLHRAKARLAKQLQV